MYNSSESIEFIIDFLLTRSKKLTLAQCKLTSLLKKKKKGNKFELFKNGKYTFAFSENPSLYILY